MNGTDTSDIWIIIIAMGLGSFALRFVFLGIIGDRPLPDWLIRHLRYTAVAILPGLVAPLVVWPDATGGSPDAARLAAAGVTLVLGLRFKNILLSIGGGAATLFLMLFLTG